MKYVFKHIKWHCTHIQNLRLHQDKKALSTKHTSNPNLVDIICSKGGDLCKANNWLLELVLLMKSKQEWKPLSHLTSWRFSSFRGQYPLYQVTVYKVNVQQGAVTALTTKKHHDRIGFCTMVPWRTNLKCISRCYISTQCFDIYCTIVLETIL